MFLKNLPCDAVPNSLFHYVPGTRESLRDTFGGGVHEIKIFLAIILRRYWPVFTLFSHEYVV